MTVEGNTDERGSREYNRARQKRSERQACVLTLLGVNEAQIETVSFGEEKPRNPASSRSSVVREPPLRPALRRGIADALVAYSARAVVHQKLLSGL